jgi:hypothetical protein
VLSNGIALDLGLRSFVASAFALRAWPTGGPQDDKGFGLALLVGFKPGFADLKFGHYTSEEGACRRRRPLQNLQKSGKVREWACPALQAPVAGDGGVAAGAVPCPEIVFEDIVPGATDEKFVAVGAMGIGGVGINVALVDVVEANFACDLASLVEGLGRSARFVLKLEVGMKGGEV